MVPVATARGVFARHVLGAPPGVVISLLHHLRGATVAAGQGLLGLLLGGGLGGLLGGGQGGCLGVGVLGGLNGLTLYRQAHTLQRVTQLSNGGAGLLSVGGGLGGLLGLLLTWVNVQPKVGKSSQVRGYLHTVTSGTGVEHTKLTVLKFTTNMIGEVNVIRFYLKAQFLHFLISLFNDTTGHII